MSLLKREFFQKIESVQGCADSIMQILKSNEYICMEDALRFLREYYLKDNFAEKRKVHIGFYIGMVNKYYGFAHRFDILHYANSKRFICAKIRKKDISILGFVPNSENSRENKMYFFLDKTDLQNLLKFCEGNPNIKYTNYAKNVKNECFLQKTPKIGLK